MRFLKARTVSGVSLPRRRFTGWAALYFVAFVCVPVLGFALVVDVALYFLVTRLLGRCYGVLCLLT